jgi:hypothetical protein
MGDNRISMGGRMKPEELPENISHELRDLASDMSVPVEWVLRAVWRLGTSDGDALAAAVEDEAVRVRTIVSGGRP